LWVFRVAGPPALPEELATITYGILPKLKEGYRSSRAEQVFPVEGHARTIARGEKFVVKITYEYDAGFPPVPCSGVRALTFQVETDGSISPHGIASGKQHHTVLPESAGKL
jgi:hypothetical protein